MSDMPVHADYGNGKTVCGLTVKHLTPMEKTSLWAKTTCQRCQDRAHDSAKRANADRWALTRGPSTDTEGDVW